MAAWTEARLRRLWEAFAEAREDRLCGTLIRNRGPLLVLLATTGGGRRDPAADWHWVNTVGEAVDPSWPVRIQLEWKTLRACIRPMVSPEALAEVERRDREVGYVQALEKR